MARVEAVKVVSSAWATALAAYEKELNAKNFLDVQKITSPSDVAKHVEDLEANRRAHKHSAIADRIHAITGRLIKFSSVIDAITSSSLEAALIWGSLKVLLTAVHRTSGEFYKVCDSIVAFGNFIPSVELLATTFDHSELVCSHVVAFYESVLQFWSKALNFYKGRRMFKFSRVWHDFDSEFGNVKRNLERHRNAIEKAAAAVHMSESRIARIEQTAVNHELVEAKRSLSASDRHRDIVKWLAPLNHEASYFADDLRSAYESRHSETCTWVLHKPEFEAWMNSSLIDSAMRMLWLTGVPGAGKTVLSSFVINKCSESLNTRPSAPVLYFFFKATDSDKNSVLAVTRSLVYQLYLLFPARLCPDIVSLKDNSGKDNALSDQRLWDLFVKHAKDTADLTIVLDALDECDGVDVLLGRMMLLLQRCRAKSFVVSRKEENIARALEDYPNIVITPKDVEVDIQSYIVAEIDKIPRFRGKPVQRRITSALSSGHDGMFLWAYLMIEEMKELGTVRQVDDALGSLPRGLEKMHQTIITRLDATLRSTHRELAIKILMWVVCAVRPLRLVELQEILRFEIRGDGTAGQQLIDNDDLLYSEKDIELACGALVLTRNATLQLIHLSTKEILLRKPTQMPPNDPRLAFYVDAQRDNTHMATFCVSYMSTHLNGIEALTRPNLEAVSRLNPTQKSYDLTTLLKRSPFIDYASISWQAHLIEGKVSLGLEKVMHRLRALLTYDLTILWVESCVSLHRDILFTLERDCKEIMSWADYASVPAESSSYEGFTFLWAWANAVLSIIHEYGHIIKRYPHEIHYLDLGNIFRYDCTPGSPILPASYTASQRRNLQEQISAIHAVDKHPASVKVDPRRQLQRDTEELLYQHRLGFLLYDSKREVYFTAESRVSNGTEVLWVQERAAGRRLQPVRNPLDRFELFCRNPAMELEFTTRSMVELHLEIKDAVLSSDCTYLAILYGGDHGCFVTSIWIIECRLDFQDIRNRRPWARRLHCSWTQNSMFQYSCRPLAVGPDNLFYCPTGQIHPERGIQKRIPNHLVFPPHYTISGSPRPPNLAFTSSGRAIITRDWTNRLVEEISWLDDIVTEPLHWCMPASDGQQTSVHLRAISQTARFMVYGIELKDRSFAGYYLLDKQGNLQQLQVKMLRAQDYTHFYFSQDEQHLLGVGKHHHTQHMIHFSRWAVSEAIIVPQAETSLFIPGFDVYLGLRAVGRLCVAEKSSSIFLVSDDRILYVVDLQSLEFKEPAFVTQKGSITQNHPYCQTSYLVSRAGSRVVGIYIRCSQWVNFTTGENKEEQLATQDSSNIVIELKFADLFGAIDQTQTFELKYPDPRYRPVHLRSKQSSSDHSITFSPDLSILQTGPHIFDLSAPSQRRLTFHESPLDRWQHGESQCVSFSACNGYLIIFDGVEDGVYRTRKAEVEGATFELFRICRAAGQIEKIPMEAPDDLVADSVWAAFHPILPLLLLTYINCPKNDVKGRAKVTEIDLRTFKAVQITVPNHDGVKRKDIYRHNYRHNYFFTRAKYSDCGSFCFLRLYNGILFLESSVLQQKQAKMHVPAVWHRGTSYNRSFYDLNWPYEHRVIEMYEAVLRPRRCGLRDIFGTSPRSKHRTAVAITAFPDHLTTAEVHLLAGRSGDDPVRMLFLPEKGPPEVKYLRVTLNQILAKLDEVARAVEAKLESSPEEFEEQWERHSDLTSEDAWEGSNSCSEEGSDIESEDAADKDELEGHRSNIEETSGVESEVAAMSANET